MEKWLLSSSYQGTVIIENNDRLRSKRKCLCIFF